MKHLFQKIVFELSRTYRGSNRISYLLRQYIEGLDVKQLLGVNLAAFSFFAAVIVPQADELASTLAILGKTKESVIEVVPTEATLQWPMRRFGLSQGFTIGHAGLDMTAPVGSPVYSISEGWVTLANDSVWGYGQHIILQHDSGVASLYAHLSRIDVTPGQTVSRNTKIGEVGMTGWTTGSHLHVEIYENNTPVDPLEVLPEIK